MTRHKILRFFWIASLSLLLLLINVMPALAQRAPVPDSPQAQLIVDGGFENGGIPSVNWDPETSTNFGTPLCDNASCGTGGGASPPRTGLIWAWFGGIPAPETATLGQTVNIPNGVTANLNFWMRIGTVSSPFTDVLNVRVDGTIVQSFPEPTVAEGAYTLRTINMDAFTDGANHQILFEYIGPSSGTGSYVVDDVTLDTTPVSGPPPNGAVSRKVHGGTPRAIILPLTGTPGIECRTDGTTGDYEMVISFANSVTVNGGNLPQADVTSGTGDVGTGGVSNGGSVGDGTPFIFVPLTNIANAQTIVVTLFNVDDGTNPIGNVSIPMSVLIGDSTGSGSVNSTDVSQTKSRSGQTVSNSNFRNDVNVNNAINSSDVSLVKSKSGTALPP